MRVAGTCSGDELAAAVKRSLVLQAMVDAAWDGSEVLPEPRAVAAAGLCGLALNHGRAVRTLLLEIPPSAIALLRPQLEALVRAVWARHAARANELSRLMAPLSIESQQVAKKLPGITDMLAALEVSGPRGAAALLSKAKARLGDGLNSYIHGGIHPFQRSKSGYPVQLLMDVLKNSNAMTMLTLLVLAEITTSSEVLELRAGLHDEFGELLPELEPFAA